MQCPKCGSPRAKYRQMAGYKKKPKEKNWKRTDFTADCPECGYHYNAETGDEIIEKKKDVPELSSPLTGVDEEFRDDRENMTDEELEDAETKIEESCMAEGN